MRKRGRNKQGGKGVYGQAHSNINRPSMSMWKEMLIGNKVAEVGMGVCLFYVHKTRFELSACEVWCEQQDKSCVWSN